MKKPRIKPVHNPVRLPDGGIRIGSMQFGIGAELRTNDDDALWEIISAMDGTRTAAEIALVVRDSRPDLTSEGVHVAIDELIRGGFVEEADVDDTGLTARDTERHARARHYFSWVDIEPRVTPWEVQRQLKESRVAILGLGGAGSVASINLVAAGIGSVRCADYDVVELSNLNRQLLFSEADLGRPKVDVAVEELRQRNSDVAVTAVLKRITSALRPGGRLLLETVRRSHVRRTLRSDRSMPVIASERGRDAIIDRVRSADDGDRIAVDRLICRGNRVRRLSFASWTYDLPDLVPALIDAGFAEVHEAALEDSETDLVTIWALVVIAVK